MAPILRVRSVWSGFSGAPGYTNLHFRDFGTGDGAGTDPGATEAAAATTRVRAFWFRIAAALPSVVKLDVDPEVDLIESTTGELINSFNTAPTAQVVGTAAQPYSGPSGAVINWRTNGIRSGRRIRGRTFVVPLANTSYTVAGVLAASVQANILGAAQDLSVTTGSPDLVVYARPTGPGATDGQVSAVTSASVPNLAAILRSRRD